MGHAAKARELMVEANALDGIAKNPFELATGRFFESWLNGWLREPKRAEAAATQALAISEEHGFPFAGP